MGKSKHTPGPWKVEIHTKKEHNTVNHEMELWSQNRHIATIYEHVDSLEVDKANAALIAAAPELLEALKSVLDDLERYAQRSGPGPDSRLVKCISAINKAEGRGNE